MTDRPFLTADVLDRALDATPRSSAGAHLADAPFRFAPGPSCARVPRPAPGEPMSLAQTLQEIRLRGVTVRRGSRGLKVRHAHRLSALAAAVAAYEPAVGVWLDLGGADAPAHGWDDATALHVRWLRTARPETPVALRPGERITDWDRFVASAEDRFAEGPDAVTAPTLQRDLATLFERFALHPERGPVGRSLARAA